MVRLSGSSSCVLKRAAAHDLALLRVAHTLTILGRFLLQKISGQNREGVRGTFAAIFLPTRRIAAKVKYLAC